MSLGMYWTIATAEPFLISLNFQKPELSLTSRTRKTASLKSAGATGLLRTKLMKIRIVQRSKAAKQRTNLDQLSSAREDSNETQSLLPTAP